MAHALLSPSSASRWMACTPSAVLEKQFPDSSSSFAEEGSLAHALCEILIKSQHNLITVEQFNVEFEKIKKDKYYNDQMLDYCEAYAAFVNDQCKGEYFLFIEQKLNMTTWIEDGAGTADGIVALPQERKAIFDDLKYGKGIRVDAKHNSQLKIYALGVLETLEVIFGKDAFDTIETHIYQPRLDSISSYSYTVKELLDWAEKDLKPKATLAFKGEGEFKAGSHCGFCKARATCRALADYNMELAKHDFANPDLLNDEEVLKIYEQKAIFENWMDAVSGYVLGEALNGKSWPGYKLVEGRSVRSYSDPIKVAEALKAKKYEDIYKPQTLLALGEMEKKIGKAPFNEIVAPLLVRPEGKPTLTVESDKRPAWTKSVENDFNVEI
jgi:hypothetical protein